MKSVSSEQCVRRCRELMRSARDASAIEQLRVWLNELEQDAGATERSSAHPAAAFQTNGGQGVGRGREVAARKT